MKKFFKFGCLGIITIFAILVVIMIIDIANDDPKSKEKPKETVTATAKWEEKIKEVASSNKNPNEKFDEVSKYAHAYKASKDEVKQFGDAIIKEYKDKNYIKDISNHEYMLTNISKSQVVDRNASEKPLKDFAFDFWQNSKYNYRGVENATSSATQANKRQMDKSLSKMNKYNHHFLGGYIMKVVRSIFKGFRLIGLIVKPVLKALSKSKF